MLPLSLLALALDTHTLLTRNDLLRSCCAAAAAVQLPPLAAALPPLSTDQPPPNVLYLPPSVKTASTPEALALAKHLKARGAKLYGAYWCSHCYDQKQAFGADGSRALNYVECAADGYQSQRSLCQANAVRGYPTWEIDGDFVAGERTLEELAELSRFRGAGFGGGGGSM